MYYLFKNTHSNSVLQEQTKQFKQTQAKSLTVFNKLWHMVLNILTVFNKPLQGAMKILIVLNKLRQWNLF